MHHDVRAMSHVVTEVAAAEPGLLPVALVKGSPLAELPKDLYIPPDALEIFLDAFEGPLDLLLYLIKRQNLDILDIPIAEITRQYMTYVEVMKGLRLELAAEYLVMAAMLAEIKSRMLLPRPASTEGEEEDPRAELIRRLQEYERFKRAAEELDELPRMERDTYTVGVERPVYRGPRPQPTVQLTELLLALKDVLARAEMFSHHHVQLEPLSVRERMSDVLVAVSAEKFTAFAALFKSEEGRLGVVVTFLAMLELIKGGLIEIIQTEVYGPIYLRAPSHVDEPHAVEEYS